MVRVHIDLPGQEDLNSFLDEFQRESDRAAAVLGAAYLEDLLEQLLRRSLLDEGVTQGMFEGFGPLSSFGAKVSIAVAMGVVTAEDAGDLNLIRKTRNLCAHEIHGLTFEDQRIVDRCRQLQRVQERMGAEPGLDEYPQDPRSLFNLGVALSCYYLMRRIHNAQAPTPAQPPLHLPYGE